MDLRSEISQSKQPSAAESDQNKLPNVDCGNILNPTPLARFNPYDNLAKKQSPVKKRLTSEVNVQGKPRFNPYDKLLNKKSPSSKKQTSDVIKASFDQGTSDMGKSSVDQVKVIVDQGKESTDVISAVVAELAKTEKETGIEKESEKNLLSEKETETEIETDKETGIEKESEKILLSEKEMETEIETEKQKEIEKESEKESEKQKEIEKESEKQKEIEKKESEKMVTYKSRVKKLAVVKDKATDKVSDVLVEKKAEKEKDKKIKLKFKVMEPVKTTPKSSEKKSAKVLSEASVLRSKKQKEIEKEETQTKRKLVLAKVDDISKKPKHKVKKDADEKKKRKRGDSSGSDKGEDITPEDKGKKKMKGKGPVKVKKDDSVKEEDILPEGVMKQLVNKFLKSSLVKAETDEENESKLSKKGKKKEKVLTPSEIQHQEYLQKWPILQARSAPTALHTAIHGVKNVDMQKFLVEIGFGSYVRFDITKIPGRLGRYVVENFDAETCRLKLERERFIEATVSKVHELLGIPIGGQSLLSLETRPVGDEFEKVWLGQFEGKSAKQLRVNDIANKLIESKEVDFLFKVNFLTLFTNTMGMVAGMQGEINFDVLKHVREDTDIRSIDWCDYIFHCLKISKKPSTLTNKYTGPYTLLALLYLDSTNYTKLPVPRTRPAIKQWSSHLMSQRHDMELKEEYFGMSELFDESELPETEGFVAGCSSSYKKDLLKNLEEKLAAISNERACFEELLTTAGLEYPGDLDLIELHKKYVQIFKHPVALNGEDLDLDDDNGNDRRLSVMINPSPIKEGNDDGKKDKDAEEQGDAVPETKVDEPLSLTQWIENNLDLIEEWFNLIAAEFYYQKCVAEGTMEPMGVGIPGAIIPHNIATRASDVSPSPVKRLVKPSSYLLSPYMNKKTRVELKMTRLEWMLGNSIFAMRGEKLERVFETRYGELYSVRLIMETLAPGLEVDANVIDCLGAILNQEKHSRDAGCPLRHFFPTGCITVSMFNGTLKTEDAKFEEFEKEISAQFKNDVGGLALDGVELAFFPIRKANHFYVVVFSLTKKLTTMTILDNSDSGATYKEKYEDTCELLKTLFARHLKLYGHNKHASIRKVKPRIANLKWKTKNNSIDCGVFTMLHMDNYTGEAAGKWDCGLVAESKEQSNQLRVLRFKLATKILLNEVNVHAARMYELALEFDKLPPDEKMSIIISAVRNREERDLKF